MFIDGDHMMMKGARIVEVQANSLAEELGIEAGDVLLGVNTKPIKDLIEFQFAWADEQVILEIQKKSGECQVFEIEKDYDEPLGVVFAQAVFDKLKLCHNHCIFCFVDQIGPNMRPGLSIKDDDYRLSFMQGSYITLTNLTKEDFLRIKREHLSPLYVSVHTTNSLLREKMLKNPKAGEILTVLKDLALAGIEFHTQVVLCPHINDGIYLEQTYHDLKAIPQVRSLAIVPVGLTKYREKLTELRTFTNKEAESLVEWVEIKQQECRKERGSSFVWLSDEFYLLAQGDIPPGEVYEDFPQLENGVGLIRVLWDEFAEIKLPKIIKEKEVVLVTGVSGEKALEPIVKRLNQIKGLSVRIKVVTNCFFGPSVTVTGLLTGTCLLEGLKDLKKGSIVFIPSIMLKNQQDTFLDDYTTQEVAELLNIHLIPVPVNAKELIMQLSKV